MAIKDTHSGHHGAGELPKVADPGAVGSGYIEADIAKRINQVIRKYAKVPDTTDYKGRNVNQILANTTANMNRYPGDYHISIHLNAFNGKASGVEVWYWAGDEPSRKKAVEMASELSKLTGLPNRGAKATASFYVLRNSKGRTLLLEIGFIDNPNDMKKVVPKIDAIGKKIAQVMGHKVTTDSFNINNYHTKKFAMIRLVKDDWAYKEKLLKTKVGDKVKKGTILTVVGIEYSGKYPRFKLKSGLYITTRKDTVEEYKKTSTGYTARKIGEIVTVKKTATKYQTGQNIASFVKGSRYRIVQVKNVNQSNSKRAYLLAGINSWLLEQDVQ